MEVKTNGIYNRQQLAEILDCSERTIDFYYTLGLPRKKDPEPQLYNGPSVTLLY